MRRAGTTGGESVIAEAAASVVAGAEPATVGKPGQPLIFAPLRCLDHVLYAFGLPAIGTWGCTPLTAPLVIR